MVGVNIDGGPKEDGAELFECFSNGKKFFFNGGVIMLKGIKLLGIEGNGEAVLFDDDPQLMSKCLELSMK